MNVLKHTIKKFIYGTLPYYFMKGYKPDSPYLKYYKSVSYTHLTLPTIA